MDVAKIIKETLHYVNLFKTKTIVIKLSGGIINTLSDDFFLNIGLLKELGINVVIIHGGGEQLTKELKKRRIEFTFKQGLRVTTEEAIKVVEEVLNRINKELTHKVNAVTKYAIGISGKIGNIVLAQKISDELQYTGEVRRINTKKMKSLLKDGYIPIISSLGVGKEEEIYNINADSVASAVAIASRAIKLIMLTNVDGIYLDKAKKNLISTLTLTQARKLIEKNIIEEGMIPKVLSCIRALERGVSSAHILNAKIPDILLLELFTDKGRGTMIIKDELR